MSQRLFILFISILPFSSLFSEANEADKEENSLKTGIFSLRGSQQPGPLVGVGENIIDAEQVQYFFFGDFTAGNHNFKSDGILSILYGITEDFSIFFNLPFSPKNRVYNYHSSGLEDVYIQIEYAYYAKKVEEGTYQATILTNVAFPSGSTHKNPPTGFGSPSFTIGTTFNYTSVDWFYFGALEGILTTSYNHTKFGDQFLYEIGAGRAFDSPPGWIFAWMLEFDGVYSEKNRLNGSIDPNSGGNTIFITPSIWISNENIVFQLGVGPVFQSLNGSQAKQHYAIDLNLGYTF